MFDRLQQYLSVRITPELTSLYIFALTTLEVHLGQGVVDFTEAFIHQYKDDDQTVMIDNLTADILDLQITTLSKYGIIIEDTLVDEKSIEPLTTLLHAFSEIEAYEDPSELYNAIESTTTDMDALAELLKIVSGEGLFDFELIKRMNESTIANIKSVLEEKIRAIPEEVTLPPDLTLLHRFCKNPNLKVIDVLHPPLAKMVMNKPRQLTLSSILSLYGNTIADLDNLKMPYNWLFAVLGSQEGDLNLLFSTWSRFFLEEQNIMMAQASVQRLYNELVGAR